MVAYGMHPDDEPGFSDGSWGDRFNTYAEACAFYGADSPTQLEAEAREMEREWLAQSLDDTEARGGPDPQLFHTRGPGPALAATDADALYEEVPF